MVTGRRAFEGRSQASLISAILKDDPPPPSSLQPLAPATLDRVVTKCLAKDPDDRWQTARDLLDELKWVAGADSSQASVVGVPRLATTEATAPAVVSRANPRPYAWIAAGVLLATTLGLAATMYFRRPPEETRVYRSTFIPPANLVGIAAGRLALSPDGRRLAFVAVGANNRPLLWVRALDSVDAHSLSGTENALTPFWSPDSRYLAFFADGKLKKVDASGGPPVTLCDSTLAASGTWNRDDVILFTPALGSPIFVCRPRAECPLRSRN
jgi:hypothetical protein